MKKYSQQEVEDLIDKYENDMSYYGRDNYYNIEEAKIDWKLKNLKNESNN